MLIQFILLMLDVLRGAVNTYILGVAPSQEQW